MRFESLALGTVKTSSNLFRFLLGQISIDIYDLSNASLLSVTSEFPPKFAYLVNDSGIIKSLDIVPSIDEYSAAKKKNKQQGIAWNRTHYANWRPCFKSTLRSISSTALTRASDILPFALVTSIISLTGTSF